jgi:hypothetical protein
MQMKIDMFLNLMRQDVPATTNSRMDLRSQVNTNSEATRDTCRLLVLENPTTYGHLRYPMNEDTFECMRKKWEFPPQHEISHAIFAGGCASFKVETKTGDHIHTSMVPPSLLLFLSCIVSLRRVLILKLYTLTGTPDFLIGGGIATFSVGAIYSHDVDLNITTGCIILGQKFKWREQTRIEFCHSLRDFSFNPIAIPVLVASILIHKIREERGAFVVTLKTVEELIESIIMEQSIDVEKEGLTQKDYRSLITKLSQSARRLRRIQMMIERAKLVVKFVARSAGIPNTLARDTRAEANEASARATCIATAIETAAEIDGSKADTAISPHIPIRLRERIELFQSILEHMDADMINLSARLTSQDRTTTNLVTQQDVYFSFRVATDSKAIAAAAHRDGATMKLIGWIGAAFLPANIVAVSQYKSCQSNAYFYSLFSHSFN